MGEEAVFVAEAGGLGEGVDSAADGIGAVEDGSLGFDEFDLGDGLGVDGVPILYGAAAPGGVVEADAVEKEEVLSSGEAANVGGAVGGGGLLDEDAGGVEEGLREGAGGVFFEVFFGKNVGSVGDVLGGGSAFGGDEKRFEGVLSESGEGEEKKQRVFHVCRMGLERMGKRFLRGKKCFVNHGVRSA